MPRDFGVTLTAAVSMVTGVLVIFPMTAYGLGSFNEYLAKNSIVIQQEPPIQSSGVKILSSSIFTEFGSLTVVGELQNTLNHTIQNVGIVYTFYDSQNKVVATASATAILNVKIDVLRPGEKSPFSVGLSDPLQIEKSNKVKVSISWEKTAVLLPAYLKLSIGNNYSEQVGGRYHVVGEVTNKGNLTASSVRISGAFYNDKNNVVSIADTFTTPSTIDPNQTAPFDLSVSPPANTNITSASINVQSAEYAMINNKLSDTTQQTLSNKQNTSDI